jgi:hypothetical protein
MLICYILVFGVMYLSWCDFAMDLTKEQRVCIKFCANLRKIAIEKESMNRTWESECLVQTSPKLKNVTQMKNKVKSMLIIFFDIKGIIHKEFVLAGQTVNSAYYCDILWRLRKNVWRLHLELWWQKELVSQHNVSYFLFHQEMFDQKQHDCHPPPTLLVWLGPLWIFCFPNCR